MINQHLQTAILPQEVATAMLPERSVLDAIARSAVPEAIAELQEFIALRPNAREVRKALFCQAGLSRVLI
jgi:hypothetical protein